MNDRFKIFVDQLRDGHMEIVEEQFSPQFLDITEEELQFPEAVNLQGEAYLAEDNLVLHFNVYTHCIVPCAICNGPVKKEVRIQGLYHAIPLKEIKSGVYNFEEFLRENILLEVPLLAECAGNCPERKHIEKYIKEESSDSEENGYKPFQDIHFDTK